MALREHKILITKCMPRPDALATKFLCVSMAPFGSPVVPDV